MRRGQAKRFAHAFALYAACAGASPARADGYVQDHLAATRLGLGLAIELDGLHGAPSGLFSDANAPMLYRPTLFGNYRITRCSRFPRCSFLVAGVEISAARKEAQYAAGTLTVDTKKLWLVGALEYRWVLAGSIALHTRVRLGIAGSRLGVADKIAGVSVSDWIARVEAAALVGLRLFSLVVLEAGLLHEFPSTKQFHWGPDHKPVDTPAERMQVILRAGFEYRFGSDQ
ncbi:MAG: hypothetical protein ABW352_20330 [Polyangiales bacterium]